MDVWLAGDDPWLARSALLHMNRWNGAIDADWLVAACLARAGNTDFFIRKAVGWALREYSKVDEAAVVAFVGAHERELSGLSRREPRMWLGAPPPMPGPAGRVARSVSASLTYTMGTESRQMRVVSGLGR